jgi:hypothetical protein
MNSVAEAQVRGAEALLSSRSLNEALKQFELAESAGANPDRCAAGRWMIHMLQGDFEAAWKESDAIRERKQPDEHRFWQGESLQGKRVMLRSLHGFGDAVQFLRYLPQLRAVARSLVVEVNPRFVELAKCFNGVDEVITWGDEAPTEIVLWDVQIEIMELPYLFRTQFHELPLYERYLRLPTQSRIRSRVLEAYQVGLVWKAGEWSPERSISFTTLRPLLDVGGCEFWDLGGTRLPDGYVDAEGFETIKQDPECRDSIIGLARTISQLDLVITVDTLAAHLAGALGIPCIVLLQHAADWRWMHGREDSPWYPSLQLIRQQVAGDWSSVIAVAYKVLQQRVAANQCREACSQ